MKFISMLFSSCRWENDPYRALPSRTQSNSFMSLRTSLIFSPSGCCDHARISSNRLPMLWMYATIPRDPNLRNSNIKEISR